MIENLEKNLCDIARKLEEQPAKLEAKHKERHANEVSVLSEKVISEIHLHYYVCKAFNSGAAPPA